MASLDALTRLQLSAANHYSKMMTFMSSYPPGTMLGNTAREIFAEQRAIEAPFYLATMTAEDTEYYWHCWRCHENGYFVGQDNADALSHVSRSGHSVRVLITRSFTYKAVNT